MLMTIDVGNSNIKFGVYQKDKLMCSFRLNSDIERTEDEFGSVVLTNLRNGNIDHHKIKNIIVASVILTTNAILDKFVEKYFKTKAVFVGPNLKSGIKITIEQPKSLGADLLIGAVGAKEKYGLNTLIIDMGTATKMYIVNDKNEFIGGAICPGLKTSAISISKSTSLLPLVDLEIPKQVICRETIACIQSGLMHGYASMIDGMIYKMKKEYDKELKVILTGGLAKSLMDILENDIIYDENLLLDGLRIIYHLNMSKGVI
ncbi:MAG: type III pantothenate kinase [Bacilli bacterium]|jgi:type III pantothenate kinase|nr:type III pantothenate kinase [Bacilli bacterium]